MYGLTTGEMPVLIGEMPLMVDGLVRCWQAGCRTFPLFAENPAGGGDNGDGDDNAGDDGEGDGDGDGGTFDAERAKALIAKLRNQVKSGKATERELAAARKKLSDIESANLSETERLRLENEELKRERERVAAERQVMRDEQAVYEAAVSEGAVKPKLIIRLIDRDAIQHDADGKPTNALDLVKKLLRDEPYLKGEGAQGVPGTPRATGQINREDRIKENEQKLASTGLFNPL